MSNIDTFPQIFVPNDFVTDNYKLIEPIVPIELRYDFTPENKSSNRSDLGALFVPIFIFTLIYAFREPYFYLPIWIIAVIIVGNYYYKIEKEKENNFLFKRKQYDKMFYDNKEQRNNILEFKNTIKTINSLKISNFEKRLLILSEQQDRFEININITTFNRIGYSENYFYENLCKAFGAALIKRGLTVNGYTPDFIYKDANNLINLVIEIDEPYILDSGEPIHFDEIDKSRNEAFVEINWGVIRFTEMQVVKETNNCIDTIKSVLDVLLGNTDIYSCHNSLERKWSYESAKLMADNYFREEYLGIPMNKRAQKPNFYYDDDDDLPF